jgi:transposase
MSRKSGSTPSTATRSSYAERCSSTRPADSKQRAARPIAAVRCVDPFHVVMLATDALDEVRREVWNEARKAQNMALAKNLKGTRYALWKNPENLTGRQRAKLSEIQQTRRAARRRQHRSPRLSRRVELRNRRGKPAWRKE